MKKLLKLFLVQIPLRTIAALFTIIFAPIIILGGAFLMSGEGKKFEDIVWWYWKDCIWSVIKEGF